MIKFITALDMELLWFIHDHFQFDLLDKLMIFITHLGDSGVIWIIFAAIFIINRRTRRIGISMLISMLLCYFLGNLVLKPLFGRPRPFLSDPSITLLRPPPNEFSFPSGHSMNSFSAASAIFTFNKKYGIVAFILASLIAVSRVYLMVHYPTDIIAGCIVGLVTGAASHLIVENLIDNPDIPKIS